MVSRGAGLSLVLLTLLLLGGRCGGGDGDTGGGSLIQIQSLDPRCVPIAGKYPSGFDLLPGGTGHAVAVQYSPAGLIALDLNTVPPSTLTQQVIPPVPPDSDGDGIEDSQRSVQIEGCPCPVQNGQCTCPAVAVMGGARAVSEGLVFVSASDYEEVVFFESPSGSLAWLWVENPVSDESHLAEDYPYLPEGGERQLRTALSTRVCVYPPEPVDSLGDAIAPEPLCDPAQPSYLTSFTAGTIVVRDAAGAEYLFVATSNLRGGIRFNPGTVLVYRVERDDEDDIAVLRPDVEVPVIFTAAFNPTAVASYTAQLGGPGGPRRELVLVTATGAIGPDVGASNVKTEGAVEVIDAASRTRVATIPLGLAGPSFGELAVASEQQLAFLGATSQRYVYAVDLAPLNDAALYEQPPGEVAILDGTDPPFPDARIYWADSPFEIPHRADGPPARMCAGETSVAVNHKGSELFVTDRCDGTLAVIDLWDPLVECQAPESCCSGVPPPRVCLDLRRVDNILAPSDAVGEPRQPSMLRVRPGEPGVDYAGPDVFFVVGQPEGHVCGVRIESLAPSP